MDDRFGVNSSYLAGEDQYQYAHKKGKEEGGVKESWYGFRKACVDGRADASLLLFYSFGLEEASPVIRDLVSF